MATHTCPGNPCPICHPGTWPQGAFSINVNVAVAAKVDRSPEGQDAQRLDRNDESAVAKRFAQNPVSEPEVNND